MMMFRRRTLRESSFVKNAFQKPFLILCDTTFLKMNFACFKEGEYEMIGIYCERTCNIYQHTML